MAFEKGFFIRNLKGRRSDPYCTFEVDVGGPAAEDWVGIVYDTKSGTYTPLGLSEGDARRDQIERNLQSIKYIQVIFTAR